jgi:hypothetical protein
MIYRHLGINPSQETVNLEGRPFPILPSGELITELI